jgi:hypothetical protein
MSSVYKKKQYAPGSIIYNWHLIVDNTGKGEKSGSDLLWCRWDILKISFFKRRSYNHVLTGIRQDVTKYIPGIGQA